MSESNDAASLLRGDASNLQKALQARGVSLKLSDVQEAMAAAGGLRPWNVLITKARKLPAGTLLLDPSHTDDARATIARGSDASPVPVGLDCHGVKRLRIEFGDFDGSAGLVDVSVSGQLVSFSAIVLHRLDGSESRLEPGEQIEVTRASITMEGQDAIVLPGLLWRAMDRAQCIDRFMVLAALSWSTAQSAARLIGAAPSGANAERLWLWRTPVDLRRPGGIDESVVAYTESRLPAHMEGTKLSMWLTLQGVYVGRVPALTIQMSLAEERGARAFIDELILIAAR